MNIWKQLKAWKIFLFNIAVLLAFCSTVKAENIKELFLQMPSEILKNVNRAEAITESGSDILKLKFPKDFSGEFKILSIKKDETIVGFSVYSCDESDLEIWSIKKGAWKKITDSAMPKLGEKDVVEMLKVSPATVEKLSDGATISHFFSFVSSSSDLELIVRKQKSCEIAGTVYDYKFNGKTFVRK